MSVPILRSGLQGSETFYGGGDDDDDDEDEEEEKEKEKEEKDVCRGGELSRKQRAYLRNAALFTDGSSEQEGLKRAGAGVVVRDRENMYKGSGMKLQPIASCASLRIKGSEDGDSAAVKLRAILVCIKYLFQQHGVPHVLEIFSNNMEAIKILSTGDVSKTENRLLRDAIVEALLAHVPTVYLRHISGEKILFLDGLSKIGRGKMKIGRKGRKPVNDLGVKVKNLLVKPDDMPNLSKDDDFFIVKMYDGMYFVKQSKSSQIVDLYKKEQKEISLLKMPKEEDQKQLSRKK